MKKSLTLFLLLSCFLAAIAGAVEIGSIRDYTIVIPQNAGKQEKYSAKLLAEYLEKNL